MGATYTMTLDVLGDLRFAEPLVVEVSYSREFGAWSAKNERLNLHCSAPTIRELKADIHMDLAYVRDAIMLADDATLTGDAIALKTELRKLFGVV